VRIRRTVASATVALLCLALTGCGQQSDVNAGNTPALAGPPAADANAVAERIAEAAHLDRAGFLRAVRRSVKTNPGAHLVLGLTMGSLSIDATGEVSFTGRDAIEARMTMSTTRGTASLQVRGVRGLYYYHVERRMRPGTFFVIDPATAVTALGADLAKIKDQLEPLSSLIAMSDGYRKVRRLGIESVDGEALGHYRLEVDAKAGLRGRGVALPPGLARTWHYDVWLDQYKRVRTIRFKTRGLEFDADYTRWDRPVKVVAPKPGRIVGMPNV
jgi:hypothetical protein